VPGVVPGNRPGAVPGDGPGNGAGTKLFGGREAGWGGAAGEKETG
jgi:hypothetical protein